MKVEPDQKEEVLQDVVKTAKGEEPRRLAQTRITNRQYRDYELYMTVEEEEIILATVGDKHDEEDNDEEELAVVAHYVMTHYAEKEAINRRSISQNLGSTSWRQRSSGETRGVSSNKGTRPIQQVQGI
jgi:hypothetical protein